MSNKCKRFQCRLDGCSKSYNHATSLDKHKKLAHGVAQNGRVLSSEEFQKFAAQVSANRRRKSRKESAERTAATDAVNLNRVPMKGPKSSVFAGKQPRKSWSPIVSDVSSVESDPDVSESFNNVTAQYVGKSNFRSLSIDKSVPTTIGKTVNNADCDDKATSPSESSSSSDEEIATETERPMQSSMPSSVSAVMVDVGVVDNNIPESTVVGGASFDSRPTNGNVVDKVLAAELPRVLDGFNIAQDLLENVGGDEIDLLLDVSNLQTFNRPSALYSSVTSGVISTAAEKSVGCCDGAPAV
jgi:hypothetical protein